MMNSESSEKQCPLHKTTDKILGILDRTFQQPLSDGTIPRTFHRKTHGALRGTFKVKPVEDGVVRHGLFAEAGEYPAVVRFSSSLQNDDRKPDGRGLAIKLNGVSGELCEGAAQGIQDFVFISDESVLAPDAEHSLMVFEQLDGLEKISNADLLMPRYTIPNYNPFRIRWEYVRSVLSTIRNHVRFKNLAGMSYYSQTPYQLGASAVKYQVHPTKETRQRAKKAKGNTYRERLQNLLETGAIVFDFYVQPRTSDEDPIDNACVIWKGPTICVARLELPPQNVDATLEIGGEMGFSPWNCLKAHKPLGSINAVRRHAYRASVEKRSGNFQCPFGSASRQ